MKRLFLIAVLLIMVSGAGAAYRPGYYDRMDGKRREALKAAAKQCVAQHTRLVYWDLPVYWQTTDVYPELYNGQTRWWEMYSDQILLIRSGQSALSSFSANRMQREHSIPKSWWKKNGDVEYTPAYTDLWNLYPSQGTANQAKLNYPFGITDKPTFDNGVTRVGPARAGYGGGSGNVFEPGDEYKGDFARSIFYMAVVYDDLDWVYSYMFRKAEWPTLQPWAYDMLLQWARQDPVSQKEIDRNNAVEQAQGNRNPFIDFPELGEYIWGTRTSETFYIKDQGGPVTPPITGDPELTQPENGMALDFGEAAVGSTVSRELQIEGRNFTEALSLRLSGPDRNLFTLSARSIPAAEINTTGAYRVTVLYKPLTTGEHQATLSVYDGGLPMGSDVAVTLRGQGLPVPTLSTLEALPASNISDTEYTANWTESPDVVDYYVVNRVRYLADGAEASAIESDQNSLLIDDRDPAVMESYTVQASRLGYLSSESNSITVAAGTSVAGIEAETPLVIGTVEGGFILLGSEPRLMAVYDMAGRTVIAQTEVQPGEPVELPQGIYVVTAPETQPVKLIIR